MAAAVTTPTRLTVLYDASCPLCRRCRDWLLDQPAYVPLELVAADSAEARTRYPNIPQRGSELVVVADTGAVWIGPEAFVMCLWALRQWRQWSYRLSGPSLAPLAERFFLAVSRNRGALFAGGARCPDAACSPPGPVKPPPPR